VFIVALNSKRTRSPSGETSSGDVAVVVVVGSHSVVNVNSLTGDETGGKGKHLSSSLTVSSRGVADEVLEDIEEATEEEADLFIITVFLAERVRVGVDPRSASTRNQSFSSSTSCSGDSSMDPNLGADFDRSTGGLQLKKNI